jgi:hypothetical protein
LLSSAAPEPLVSRLHRAAQLLPFTAACPASYPYEWQTLIASGPGYLFVAAFEGVNGAAAARHCRDNAHRKLQAALRGGLDPEAALWAMWGELDSSFLAGREPDVVGTGARRCAPAGRAADGAWGRLIGRLPW